MENLKTTDFPFAANEEPDAEPPIRASEAAPEVVLVSPV
jgi:hypothetical protein